MSQRAHEGLKRILLATDFSTRSDRATRRALLLAKQSHAKVILGHVVDDDQPRRLIESARAEAMRLLTGMQETFVAVDHVPCEVSVTTGEAFAGMLAIGDEVDADLIVIGPHRRQILKDVFIGTTAERIIRESRRPVLMVNGPPVSPYRNALLTTDLSPASLTAYQSFDKLALLESGASILLHVFDAPAVGHMRRASLTRDDIDDYVGEQKRHADAELRRLLQQQGIRPDRVVLQVDTGSVAATILQAAKEHDADIIVAGSRGQTMPAKLLLGSTTEGLVRIADHDVLAVPAPAS